MSNEYKLLNTGWDSTYRKGIGRRMGHKYLRRVAKLEIKKEINNA